MRRRRVLDCLLSIVAGLATAGWISYQGWLGGDFRIDEAHKISETAFFRLALEQNWSHPAWFDHIVDRTNPPVGKYVFGAAIAASAAPLPSPPTLSALSGEAAYIPPLHPREVSERFRPQLRSARVASLIASALTSAVLCFLLIRHSGPVAALIGVLLFSTNFLTSAYGATAVFDPLLMLLITTALLPLAVACERGRARPSTQLLLGAIGGIVIALAFQTRVTGAFALSGAAAILIYLLVRKRWRPAMFVALPLAALFTVTSITVNPLYWARAPGSTAAAQLNDPLLLRPARRLAMQYADLQELLERTRQRTPVLNSPTARAEFALQIVFGDLAGIALLAGLAATLAAALLRRLKDSEIPLLLYAGTVAMITTFWLPVAWPRYLMPIVPLLALVAATGTAEVLQSLAAAFRRIPRSRPAD
jgi:4-amino-4-deoxy-L-arabinose transferase-like glycosyltransferase